MPTRLILPQSIYLAMLAHARAEYPNEACGLLRGRSGRVTGFLAARNVAATPQTDYEVDAESLLRALSWEDEGDELIAIYHSHPHSPPDPSAVDAARAFYPDSVYLILSLQNPQEPQLKGHFLRPEAVFEGQAAARLLQTLSFRPVRPGLSGFYLPPNAPLAPDIQDAAPADGVAIFLVSETPPEHPPAVVRLISVQPVLISIQV